MIRRNFLVNLLLWILAFFFGYTIKREGEKLNLLKTEARMVLDKEGKNISEKIDVFSKQLADIATNVKSFGAKGDWNGTTGTDDTQAFLNAIAYVNTKKLKLLIPEGIYKITGDVIFPENVEFKGKVTGGRPVFRGQEDSIISGLNCDDALFSGIWRGRVSIKAANKITIDGYNDNWGTYWNKFDIQFCKELEITMNEGSVNQNTFTGGRIGYLHLTGNNTKYAVSELHNNYFHNVDVSTQGVLQDDSKMQSNYLVNVYCENGGMIVGNWQILGSNADNTPTLGVNSHILFSNDAILKNGQDFLSFANTNLVEGGEWDSLDTLGRPKGLVFANTTGSVIKDATAPDGSGKALRVTTNLDWANLVMLFSNIGNGRGAISFFGKGDISVLEFVDMSNNVYGGLFTSVDVGDGWKLYRGIFPKIPNLNYLRVYLKLGTAERKTAYFAGIKATPFKANILPYYNPNLYCRGSVSSVPIGGIWRKGEFVMNNDDSTNPTVNGWRCISDDPLTFKSF